MHFATFIFDWADAVCNIRCVSLPQVGVGSELELVLSRRRHTGRVSLAARVQTCTRLRTWTASYETRPYKKTVGAALRRKNPCSVEVAGPDSQRVSQAACAPRSSSG